MAFGIQVANYRDLETKLRRADPAVQKQFNKQLRVITKKVVVESRAKASWSTTIPPAIGSSVTTRYAAVRVSRKKSVIAVLNEFGSWRHPLFGNRDHWYTQKARPSVKPTVEANRTELRVLAERAATDALREAGF